MLAKVIPNRTSKHGVQQGFTARVAYPCRSGAAVETANLAGTWRDAAFQMQISAGLAPRVLQPCSHIVLTWAETERPLDREMFDAGHRAVAALGGSKHQYLIVIHKNRANWHVHIILNRVNPVTGAVLPTSHNFARLEFACRKIELAYGWPEDRGRFDCKIVDNEVTLVPKPATHWQEKMRDRAWGLRPETRAMRGHEHRTGMPPLRDFLPQSKIVQLRLDLNAANSWNEIHQVMAKAQLRYDQHGSGARISSSSGAFFMATGQLGSSCSIINMQARLGHFVPPEMVTAPTLSAAAARADTPPAPPNLSPVETALRSITDIIKDIKRWRHTRAEARKDLRAQQAEVRLEVRKVLAGSRKPIAQVLRQVLRLIQKQERDELRAQHPQPHPLPFDATAHLSRLAPAELGRRRYRHLLRAQLAQPSRDPTARHPDHTAHRQAWCLAQPTHAARFPKPLAEVVSRHSQDIRVDLWGTLLCAHRNHAGSIAGFTLCQATDFFAPCPRPIGSGDGLCVMGSRNAAEYVIAPDVITALTWSLDHQNNDAQIIVTNPEMTPRMQNLLAELTNGKAKIAKLTSVSEHIVQKQHPIKAVQHDENEVAALNNVAAPSDPEVDDPNAEDWPTPS
jgi:hypothetical protein